MGHLAWNAYGKTSEPHGAGQTSAIILSLDEQPLSCTFCVIDLAPTKRIPYPCSPTALRVPGVESGKGHGWPEASGLMYSGVATRETTNENLISSHMARRQVKTISQDCWLLP